MNTSKRFFVNYFKGIIIGFGTLIPGVSGGTTAIVLGVFKGILESVSNLFKDFKKAFFLLFPIFLGGVTGMVLLSSKVNVFCTVFPQFSKYLFCFLSLISTLFFVKKVLYKKFKKTHILYVISGTVNALLLTVLMSSNTLNFNNGIFSLFVIGLILSVALILPAISFSYMLLFFGIYQKTLYAIENLDLLFIIPLSMGIVFGSYVFSKILNKIIDKYPVETYSFVLGFVFTSIFDILI